MSVHYRRTPIEIESPEQLGYSTIANNLAESSFSDMCLADYGIEADLSRTLLPYGDHLGAEQLRRLIVGDDGALAPDDVLVTAGAASALFIVATTLVGAGDHVLVCAPNYATNLETPRAVSADLEAFELSFDDGWKLDLERLAARLRPDTRLVSVTYPHNPTGSMISRDELTALVALVESHPVARLLVDETYRELAYADPLPMAASLSPRVVAVSSMSKTYGLPGLRVGWLTCRDERLMETFLAAKEQIFICGAVLEEDLAARVLDRRADVLALVRAKTEQHLGDVRDWIGGHELFEWVEPKAGVVCFPRIRPEIAVDLDGFYTALLERHGTYVGPGHWFDQDRRYFRLGFAWPTREALARGLEGLDLAAASACSRA
ncbi:MAG TPA: pyridoxal phosphate-dependent aminotransferase [Gaiellaceae bacterium]|jgi:aspartate/methionine/tyrosine aminotransferase